MDIIAELGIIIVGGLFGNPMIAVLFFFGFMAIVGFLMRFTLDCWVVCMSAMFYILTLHPESNLLPTWAWTLYAIGLGIVLGIGVIKVFRR